MSRGPTVADSPDVRIGRQLLDIARRHGFRFERLAPGPDGPLWGTRETDQWSDTIYLSGFWAPGSCSAVRRRRSPIVVSAPLLVVDRVSGDALNVLNTVVSRWPP